MTEYKPEWAKKLEDWGKKQDEKWGKKKDERKPWEKKNEFIWSIAFSFIWLWVINNIQTWLPQYFTEAYPALLSVANIVVIAQILIYFLLLLISLRWFYYLGKSAENVFGFVGVVTAIAIFPFNVPFGMEYLFRLALYVGAIVSAIVAAVYLIKAFFAVLTPLK